MRKSKTITHVCERSHYAGRALIILACQRRFIQPPPLCIYQSLSANPLLCLSVSSLYLVLLLPVCLLWYFNRTDSNRNPISRTSNWAFNRLSDVCLLLVHTEKYRVTLQTAHPGQLDSLGKVMQHGCIDVLFVNYAYLKGLTHHLETELFK